MPRALTIGASYTRSAIATRLGGDLQGFLPHKDGNVVCICLDPAKNPSAPPKVPVGLGRTRLRYARRFFEQRSAVPLFIKLGRNYWEYRGNYRCVRHITDSRAVRRLADPDGRRDARAIIYIQRQGAAEVSPETDPILVGREGNLRLRMHRERERDPLLTRRKKAEARRRGRFRCEACDLDFGGHGGGLGAACAEVHHLRPLGRLGRGEEVATRLRDLALLCANCHRMVHAGARILSPSALRRRMGA
ncbi:MAG: HNH endonuclease [Candidatus Binatia bacterium]